MLGRTETRTRDRMYCQTIRTVRDISRDDRARIATCRLRTPTDRQTDILKESYSIDYIFNCHFKFKGMQCNVYIYSIRETKNIPRATFADISGSI